MGIKSWLKHRQHARQMQLIDEINNLSKDIATYVFPDTRDPEGKFSVSIGAIHHESQYEKELIFIRPDASIYIQSGKDGFQRLNLQLQEPYVLRDLRSLMIEYLSPSRERT